VRMIPFGSRPCGPAAVLLLLLLVSGRAAPAAAAGVVVIANPDLPTERIDTKALQRIYLGKLTRWENDEAVVPVMLESGPAHETFIRDYLDRSAHRFVTYWRQMVFTGKGTPPRSVDSEREMVAYVALTPGAVGYVSDATVLDGVKVLAVDVK
jgi:ABC-type phosphate transport system substrate-binding protein